MVRKTFTFISALFLLLITFGISSAYMDPETGRFITQDPYLGEVSRAPSLHRYNYANLNPAFYIDRDGHDYVEVQENKAYWVVQEKVFGLPDPDIRRVHIGNTKDNDPNNVYLTAEFGEGTVGLEALQQSADTYWDRPDVEKERSVFNPADISSLDPSLQDQLIRHRIDDYLNPHHEARMREMPRMGTIGQTADIVFNTQEYVDDWTAMKTGVSQNSNHRALTARQDATMHLLYAGGRDFLATVTVAKLWGRLFSTAASKGGAKLLPQFDNGLIDDVLTSAGRVRKQTTEGARAISKKLGHAQSGGYESAFKCIKPTQANADKLIRDIMSNPSSTTYGNRTVDVYNYLGQGVRYDRSTNKFITFIEQSLSTR